MNCSKYFQRIVVASLLWVSNVVDRWTAIFM